MSPIRCPLPLRCVLALLLLFALLPDGIVIESGRFLPAVGLPGVPCGDPPSVGSEVKVGILAFCYGQPQGIIPGGAASCGLDSNPAATGGIMSKLVQDAQQLFIDLMMEQQPIPLTNGNSTSFNYTWINLASMNWVTYVGSELISPAETRGYELYYNITQTTQYGGPFSIIIIPAFLQVDQIVQLMKHCENPNGHKCVVINPFNYQMDYNICGNDLLSLADCGSRGRLPGQRRWDNMLGVMYDSTWDADSAMDMYVMNNVKSTVVFNDIFTRWGPQAAQRAYDSARQLNIKVYGPIQPVLCPSNCAVDRVTGNIVNGFANRTAEEMAEYVKSLNPDAITLMLASGSLATQTFADMFRHFPKIGWTPKIIYVGGGGLSTMMAYIPKGEREILKWSWLSGPWDSRLRGAMYHAVTSPGNYELLSSTADDDLPQLFAKAFYQKYPFWAAISLFTGSLQTFSAFGWQSLAIAQKLIETGMTTDVDSLMIASTRIATPSLYHLMQFDPYGRSMHVKAVLYQLMDTHDSLKLISPINVGTEPIYPLPTWSERIFSADKYSDPLEQMMAAITSVAIAYCLSWYVFLAKHIRHPVIRASTPSFCALIILGAVLMLMSNYFHTLVEHDSDCSAQLWLLTIGFTLIFSCLFIKTARIWKIFFGSKKLTVVKMKDSDLLMTVAAFLCIDIIINAVWGGWEGMNSKLVVPDPIRPAQSYYTCDYNHTALDFVYTHLAVKCGLLLFGIGLTWAVRNTPSQFNESTYIGLGIYNVSLIICFVVPILASNAAGRDSYLIRAFAIIFVACSTISLLYVPKLLSIRRVGAHAGTSATATQVVRPKLAGGVTSGSGDTDSSKDLEMGGVRKSAHVQRNVSDSLSPVHGLNAKSTLASNVTSYPRTSSTGASHFSTALQPSTIGGTRVAPGGPVNTQATADERNGSTTAPTATATATDTASPLTRAGSNANGSAPTSPIPGAAAAYSVPGTVVQEEDA